MYDIKEIYFYAKKINLFYNYILKYKRYEKAYS